MGHSHLESCRKPDGASQPRGGMQEPPPTLRRAGVPPESWPSRLPVPPGGAATPHSHAALLASGGAWALRPCRCTSIPRPSELPVRGGPRGCRAKGYKAQGRGLAEPKIIPLPETPSNHQMENKNRGSHLQLLTQTPLAISGEITGFGSSLCL